MLLQKSGTVRPIGETTPMPVTTTRRFSLVFDIDLIRHYDNNTRQAAPRTGEIPDNAMSCPRAAGAMQVSIQNAINSDIIYVRYR